MSPGTYLLLICFITAVLPLPSTAAASLTLPLQTPLVSSLQELWQDVALRAAEATVKSVSKQTGMSMSLRDVYMDTFQVQLGRQHHVGLEVEGTSYEFILGSEQDAAKDAEPAQALTEATSHDLTATSSSGTLHSSHRPAPNRSPSHLSGSLVEQRWNQLRQQHTLLADLTLAGPIELVLPSSTQISAYLPNIAEVGEARRIVISEGATATIRGLKRLSLRHPIDLPSLPAQYLAEVLATLHLGSPEPGFERAPAMLYMSQQLFKAATNASLVLKRPLISLEAEASPVGLSIIAASEQPGAVPPRLKAKRLKDGILEFSTRPGQVDTHKSCPVAALLPRTWAWPLPHVDMADWLPYESVLRGLLAQHPFNAKKRQEKGTVSLRLVKSKVAGVKRVQFDMEVLGQLSKEFERPEELVEMTGEQEAPPLEVWEVVVQVDTGKDGEWNFTPLTAKRKASYQDTFSVSPLTLMLQVSGNHSVPQGYESNSLGIAELEGH